MAKRSPRSGDSRDLTLEQWDKVFAVNWRGVLYGTRAAYVHMVRQGSGHIVNVASLAGLVPHPFNAPYCASKHAVVGLSRALRYEGVELGVKVSVVCPGYVATDIFNSSKVMHVPNEKLLRLRRPNAITPDQAAGHILEGVEANREVIVFPSRERWFWRLHRLSSRSIERALLARLKELRQLRSETLASDAASMQGTRLGAHEVRSHSLPR